MAQIKAFRIPERAETTDVSDELFRYLEPLFIQVRDLSDALRGRVSVERNLNSQVRSLRLRDGVEESVRLDVDPIGAILLETDQTAVPELRFQREDQNRAKVTLTFAVAVAGDITARVLFLGAD